jgi:hypothetical protein
MKIEWINVRTPHRVPALAKHSDADAESRRADAMAGGIVWGAALLVSAVPVASLLGAVWFLVVQPALY